ncbi:hypothetical protein B0T11DRAFT_279617 [Plectosphaerella cucumerina]|uniref:J domain-containing protein n=1 Tax=Plectosphaerella cucumerina TaxID=40658 RepID=A0A8K0TGQ9_9PEZI|nr:hypothetical protein B0T11DRAFT_279617 [Plectosphaerella cucumerina]
MMTLKPTCRLVASTGPALSTRTSRVASCRCQGLADLRQSQSVYAFRRRSYATVRDAQDSGKPQTNPEKTSWPSHDKPTPYDIFGINPNAKYTKATFYHLVKLYHPDRHHHHGTPSAAHVGAISAATRLERYRLVVLANDILSDPQKRKAYDAYGAGWVSSNHSVHDLYRQADRSWRHKPGNAAGNATWEDWERWHEARDGKEHQEPVFMSNTYFLAFVLATIAIGSAMQANRAATSATHVLDQRTAHEIALADALRRRDQAAAGKGRHDRIEQFIRERENLRYEFVPNRHEHVQKSSPK